MNGYGVLYGKLGCCTNAVAGLKECIEANSLMKEYVKDCRE